MIKEKNNHYKNSRVQLDDHEFTKCRFENCVLEFSGTGAVSLIECEFSEINWVFTGPAQNTMTFLKGIYHGMGEGGKQIVEKTFDSIRQA